MKAAVVSYSMTGNNDSLASSIASALSAEHIHIIEPKQRTMGTIVWDILTRKTPSVSPAPERLDQFDMILFVGPIWMGQVATPLRSYFNYLRSHPRKYGFISISGGADGDNPKISGELMQRTGAEPAALLDLHIASLLPSEPKPDRDTTMAYRLNRADVQKLTAAVVNTIGVMA